MDRNFVAKTLNITACLGISLLVACGGGADNDSSPDAPIVSIAPVDTVAIGNSIILDGQGSSAPSGGAIAYKWTIRKAPQGSVATINKSTEVKAEFIPDIAGSYEITLIVSAENGGTANATEFFEVQPISAALDRTRTDWLISERTSSLTGVKTTKMEAPGLGGASFVITCSSNGSRSYHIETDFITGDGMIRYRVGHYPISTQLWYESQSSGYKQLTPPQFNIDLLKQFYKSNEFILDVNKFGTGTVRSEPRMSGFAAAIDKTRSACKWSESDFPRSNGWAAPLPDQAPPTAKSPTYTTGVSPSGVNFTGQFGYVAWVEQNSSNKPQLLVRVGEDKALCKGNAAVSNTSFYVEQSGRRVEALPGFVFSLGCANKAPATLALQGDFNPAQPFVLKSYLFHYSTLDTGTAFGQISF